MDLTFYKYLSDCVFFISDEKMIPLLAMGLLPAYSRIMNREMYISMRIKFCYFINVDSAVETYIWLRKSKKMHFLQAINLDKY